MRETFFSKTTYSRLFIQNHEVTFLPNLRGSMICTFQNPQWKRQSTKSRGFRFRLIINKTSPSQLLVFAQPRHELSSSKLSHTLSHNLVYTCAFSIASVFTSDLQPSCEQSRRGLLVIEPQFTVSVAVSVYKTSATCPYLSQYRSELGTQICWTRAIRTDS